MKAIIMASLYTFLLLPMSGPAFGGGPIQIQPVRPEIKTKAPVASKKTLTISSAFRVKEVRFEKILINNQEHLVSAVIFNKNVDPATVQQNTNIRLLKRNSNNYWVDASTQNNTVNIRPNFITWVSGAPIEAAGQYKMHLRGTIKSIDGQYLDCNGDGKGEGGALPPYESQTYSAPGLLDLEEILEKRKKNL